MRQNLKRYFGAFITCSVIADSLYSHTRRHDLFLTILERVRRFYDFNVWTERKRIEKLRYMHRNPMQRGLVASPELWGWSSFRFYSLSEAGPVGVNLWEVLQMKIRSSVA